ncbi:MAG: hypothetical protein ACLPUG_14845 [Acidimicrobiales bacterium]
MAIALIVLQSSIGQSLLKDAGLSRTTEPFIELYFPNPNAVPSQVPASDHLKIGFAVDNVGPATHRITWEVSEETGKIEIGLASGHTVVPASQAAVVSQRLRVYCLSKRVQLLVSVARSSARITLWLSCSSQK